MKLIRFLKVCSKVGKHGWFQTDLGFNVRKPLAILMWDLEEELKRPSKSPIAINTEPRDIPVDIPTKTLWQRIKEFIIIRIIGFITKLWHQKHK